MPLETRIAEPQTIKLTSSQQVHEFVERRGDGPLMFIDRDNDLFVAVRNCATAEYQLLHVSEQRLYSNYTVSYPVRLAPEGSLVIARQPAVAG